MNQEFQEFHNEIEEDGEEQKYKDREDLEKQQIEDKDWVLAQQLQEDLNGPAQN